MNQINRTSELLKIVFEVSRRRVTNIPINSAVKLDAMVVETELPHCDKVLNTSAYVKKEEDLKSLVVFLRNPFAYSPMLNFVKKAIDGTAYPLN